MYNLEILHQCGERIKTKNQEVLGTKSYVCRSYRGKTGRGAFHPPSWIGLSNRVGLKKMGIILSVSKPHCLPDSVNWFWKFYPFIKKNIFGKQLAQDALDKFSGCFMRQNFKYFL